MNTTSQQTTFRAARVIFSTIAVLFTVLWAAAYVTTDNPAALQRDWYCLWEAGVGFNEGRFNELYADRFQPGDHSGICREGYFWLYPPYALYPAAMLGSLPQTIAYPTVLLGVYGCYAIFLLALRRLFPTDPMSFQVFALGLLASAPLSSVVVTGQNLSLIHI